MRFGSLNLVERHSVHDEATASAADQRKTHSSVRAFAVLRRFWPMWVLAFSLNGFFLYLAVLDAIDVDPTTPLTGAYYGLLCVVLVATAWCRRGTLVTRLRNGRPTVVTCIVAATTLATWFVLNSALFSDGALARRLVGLLVLWTIPTALVALALSAQDLDAVARALVALGLIFVPIEAAAVARAGSDVFRFTPIANLDVISAGLVPAIGAIAALSLRPRSARGHLTLLAVVTVLVAAAVVPGSRGPVLALAVAAAALAFVRPWRLHTLALAAVAVGLAVGAFIGSNIGSFGYLTSLPQNSSPEDASISSPDGRARPRPSISTLSVRRHWIEDALRQIPERPVLGHGVGMFEDRTPEAKLMGIEGQRTYPHNTFVEAAYSLGAVGLLAYVVFVGSAIVALVSVIRRSRGRRNAAVAFGVGMGAFAFVNTNVSGEIGSDALLWSAAAIALVLYADSHPPRPSAGGRPGAGHERGVVILPRR